MKNSAAVFFALCLLCSSTGSIAQSSKEYLYVDSSILYDNEVKVEAPAEDFAIEEAVEIVAPDTVLIHNEIFISADSAEAVKQHKDFAYAQHLDSLLKKLKTGQVDKADTTGKNVSWLGRLFAAKATRYFFWALGAAFVLFILYRLFFADGFFRGTATSMDRYNPADETMHEHADFTALANGAVAAKNYRLATRYLYLRLLQSLTSAGAIVYAADKTNREYYYELQGKPFQQQFARLTESYEYLWYGGFEADKQLFEQIQASFTAFNKQFKI
ncbi:MAG TPA: DUF4129 domain-containing protein [Ferruginibacter sp.]|nr:DUF4129 domain-containing protein [Ferruginibacter sp.]HMP21356.1 DUF4129 domain-containing protein [Ferruginibacter sp.]